MIKIDFSKVTHEEANNFLHNFFLNRNINREYYERVPEERFDFRMVDNPTRKSDTPRESLAHQINVQRTYMMAVETGELKFGAYYDEGLKIKSKAELLSELESADIQLVELLSREENLTKKIVVPWDMSGVGAVTMFWSLNSHEVLHTGWNLALMEHLDIERFPALKAMWG